ncbi:MAG: pantoate--beta-alanine ligase [spirochete symbiont of Stewartia floridana]|nr:MAG: pantoate--beta-alanine ligase [spirochete symbiont of Stewartia floridana]
MEVVESIGEWRAIQDSLGSRTLGMVPTMGALHPGHLALVHESIRQNESTVASIFVNPMQFNNPDDLKAYPRDLERDRKLLAREDVDYLFVPRYKEIYADNYRYKVSESEFSTRLCGKSRPGHFDGVLTVVLKLFNIIAPTRAYFGEKDYQQLLLIEGMVQHLFLPIKIVRVPIVREEDGLAVSSRNTLLNENERALAGKLPQILREAANCREAIDELLHFGIEVDYIEEMSGRRFGAVTIGGVRLIDNVQI